MRYYMHLSYVIRANVINSIFMFRVFENKEREFWGYMADTFLNTDPLGLRNTILKMFQLERTRVSSLQIA